MKLRFYTYEKVVKNNPDSYIEINDLKITKENFSHYDEMPVATFPAIMVWKSKEDSVGDKEGEKCTAMYWVRESEF